MELPGRRHPRLRRVSTLPASERLAGWAGWRAAPTSGSDLRAAVEEPPDRIYAPTVRHGLLRRRYLKGSSLVYDTEVYPGIKNHHLTTSYMYNVITGQSYATNTPTMLSACEGDFGEKLPSSCRVGDRPAPETAWPTPQALRYAEAPDGSWESRAPQQPPAKGTRFCVPRPVAGGVPRSHDACARPQVTGTPPQIRDCTAPTPACPTPAAP